MAALQKATKDLEIFMENLKSQTRKKSKRKNPQDDLPSVDKFMDLFCSFATTSGINNNDQHVNDGEHDNSDSTTSPLSLDLENTENVVVLDANLTVKSEQVSIAKKSISLDNVSNVLAHVLPKLKTSESLVEANKEPPVRNPLSNPEPASMNAPENQSSASVPPELASTDTVLVPKKKSKVSPPKTPKLEVVVDEDDEDLTFSQPKSIMQMPVDNILDLQQTSTTDSTPNNMNFVSSNAARNQNVNMPSQGLIQSVPIPQVHGLNIGRFSVADIQNQNRPRQMMQPPPPPYQSPGQLMRMQLYPERSIQGQNQCNPTSVQRQPMPPGLQGPIIRQGMNNQMQFRPISYIGMVPNSNQQIPNSNDMTGIQSYCPFPSIPQQQQPGMMQNQQMPRMTNENVFYQYDANGQPFIVGNPRMMVPMGPPYNVPPPTMNFQSSNPNFQQYNNFQRNLQQSGSNPMIFQQQQQMLLQQQQQQELQNLNRMVNPQQGQQQQQNMMPNVPQGQPNQQNSNRMLNPQQGQGQQQQISFNSRMVNQQQQGQPNMQPGQQQQQQNSNRMPNMQQVQPPNQQNSNMTPNMQLQQQNQFNNQNLNRPLNPQQGQPNQRQNSNLQQGQQYKPGKLN